MPEVVVGIGKALRDREVRHQRVAVDGVYLHLVEDLGGVAECLGDIGEDLIHLLGTLEPLLLGVGKPIRVVKSLARAEADQSLVRLAILLVCEVGVIRGDQLHALLGSELDEYLIYLLLLLVGLSIAAFLVCLVPLQLQVIVLPEESFEPPNSIPSPLNVSMKDMLRHLSAKTGAGDDQSLVVLLEQTLVDPGLIVKPGREGLGRHLDQVVIALLILGQYDEVVTAAVLDGALILPTIPGTVALAAEDRLEYFSPLLLDLLSDILLSRWI